ncbi:hypothetical protein KAFR_0F03220 [Kazachstania africana CBS 2517]|uniref:arginyltransferase n=1 Tax=Kazachstania africana (strain ATCC 22294 / BCRC 22015 / CBS 2517 / CECT 1963 / NBRC 1671 / NRRL Y-8276) TaxID=1071382 RepID=H2AX18_KAZAF|nr:hypothetical protein KAFR_0F03220 [Kazachstania africana CBS 2517]CCF58918.1 hypothetical protein KAFR_0F03220 [Kazachstania africana CBS 2517]
MDLTQRLIITQPLYFQESSQKCGYCKGEKPSQGDYFALDSWYRPGKESTHTNSTIGFQCENITIETYERLCNLGFRRSGCFLYKFDMLRNCCRLFTIRTTPEEVKLTKELKTCVKHFKKFINVPPSEKISKNQPFDYINELRSLDSADFHTVYEPSVFTTEKYDLYVKYQEQVHNDYKHSTRSFKRFLCDSPFPEYTRNGTKEEWSQLNDPEYKGNFDRLGPTHECYYYEGKLIALAILDFLPSGVSSVYFIYDPEFKKLSLGKLSALKELTLVHKLSRPFYYLGYYIDDCPKMNYKSQYGGELLDVCNLNYVSLEFLKSNNMISNGRLFILGEENSISDELFMDDNLERTEFPTVENATSLSNVAEHIYGSNGVAFHSKEKYLSKLVEMGIPLEMEEPKNVFFQRHSTDKKSMSDLNNLPSVVPGLLPINELYDIITSRKINELNGAMMIYDTLLHRIRFMFDFEVEHPSNKLVIFNTIRLLGLDICKSALLII